MTDFENRRVHVFLNALRQRAIKLPIDAAESAEVVAHLSIRTAYIRESFTDGVAALLESARDKFGSHDGIARMLTADRETPSEFFDEVMAVLTRDSMGKKLPMPFSVLRRIVFAALGENLGGILGVTAKQLFDDMKAFDLSAAGRTGHNRALGKSLAPPPLVAQLRKLSWQVVTLNDEEIILPDCVALGSEWGVSQEFRALPLVDFSKIRICLMPIGKNDVLIGTDLPIPNLSAARVNQASAECSYRFFVSSVQNTRFGELSRFIGLQTASLFKEMGEESVSKLESTPASAVALWSTDPANEYDREVQLAAGRIWTAYSQERSSSQSWVSCDVAMGHLSICISQNLARVVEARRQFEMNQDYQRLLEEVSTQALNTTTQCARLLARFDAEAPLKLSQNLLDCLDDLDLRPWFDRLGLHLREVRQDPAVRPLSAVAGLAGLLERLFWQFGLIVWHSPQHGCVVFPIPLLPFRAQRL
jgi:hypothetical protein